jgi:hypothetical protein
VADIPRAAGPEAQAQRPHEPLRTAFAAGLEHLARLRASEPDAQLLGQPEFEDAAPSIAWGPRPCRPLCRGGPSCRSLQTTKGQRPARVALQK